jgi:hypothetical protein
LSEPFLGPPEEILAIGLAFAAFCIGSFGREPTLAELDGVASAYVRRKSACERYLSKRHVDIVIPDPLRDIVRCGDAQPVVFAATELGSIQLTAIALAQLGRQLITPYWGLAVGYRKVAERCGTTLIDLQNSPRPRQLIRSLEAARSQQITPLLVLEAPVQSGPRYDFFGYRPRCSRFLSMYSRIIGARIGLLWNFSGPNDTI